MAVQRKHKSLHVGNLLQEDQSRHYAIVYNDDPEEDYETMDIPPGSIVMFLRYDEHVTRWRYGDLVGMVLFGDVICSVVLRDFKKLRASK